MDGQKKNIVLISNYYDIIFLESRNGYGKIYNKLVRDNISELMIKDGWKPYTRILDDNEYRSE